MGLKWKDGKDISANWDWKQAVLAILLSDKADFPNKISQKRQRRSFHFDKGNNPSWGVNNYIHSEHWHTQFNKQTVLDKTHRLDYMSSIPYYHPDKKINRENSELNNTIYNWT
jgi:hypothetical protein